MSEYEIVVQVRVQADTPEEGSAWLTGELAARLAPDEGTGWHNKGEATPRYTIASVRQIRAGAPTPTYKRGQG